MNHVGKDPVSENCGCSILLVFVFHQFIIPHQLRSRLLWELVHNHAFGFQATFKIPFWHHRSWILRSLTPVAGAASIIESPPLIKQIFLKTMASGTDWWFRLVFSNSFTMHTAQAWCPPIISFAEEKLCGERPRFFCTYWKHCVARSPETYYLMTIHSLPLLLLTEMMIEQGRTSPSSFSHLSPLMPSKRKPVQTNKPSTWKSSLHLVSLKSNKEWN